MSFYLLAIPFLLSSQSFPDPARSSGRVPDGSVLKPKHILLLVVMASQ